MLITILRCPILGGVIKGWHYRIDINLISIYSTSEASISALESRVRESASHRRRRLLGCGFSQSRPLCELYPWQQQQQQQQLQQ